MYRNLLKLDMLLNKLENKQHKQMWEFVFYFYIEQTWLMSQTHSSKCNNTSMPYP